MLGIYYKYGEWGTGYGAYNRRLLYNQIPSQPRSFLISGLRYLYHKNIIFIVTHLFANSIKDNNITHLLTITSTMAEVTPANLLSQVDKRKTTSPTKKVLKRLFFSTFRGDAVPGPCSNDVSVLKPQCSLPAMYCLSPYHIMDI